jgi:hypothetical protein
VLWRWFGFLAACARGRGCLYYCHGMA